jgi:hypothetical protein
VKLQRVFVLVLCVKNAGNIVERHECVGMVQKLEAELVLHQRALSSSTTKYGEMHRDIYIQRHLQRHSRSRGFAIVHVHSAG